MSLKRSLYGALLTIIVIPGVTTAKDHMSPRAWDVIAKSDGVTLRARTLNDRVLFCLDAAPNLKMSAEYGVEFNVASGDVALWDETFPKVITGQGWYFDLPVQVGLKTRGGMHERRVTIDLGACSAAAQTCKHITLHVDVPSYRNEAHASTACIAKKTK